MSEDDKLPPSGFRQRGPAVTGTRLLLVRHGESYANARGVAGGPQGDGGLTPKGIRQAQALARRLAHSSELRETTAFYSSTLPRARQTAEILAPSLPATLSLESRDDLCEINVGEGDGLTWSEFVAKFGAIDWDENPDQLCAPGGESLLGFFSRCETALQSLVSQHPGELVVAVVHGGVIEQAMKVAQGHPASRRLRPRIENCSMTEIEFAENFTRILRYNDLAPLPFEED